MMNDSTERNQMEDLEAALETQVQANAQTLAGLTNNINPAPLYMLAGIETLKTALAGGDRDNRLRLELLHETIFGQKLAEMADAGSGLVVARSVPNLEANNAQH
jgi:hypothetical protein